MATRTLCWKNLLGHFFRTHNNISSFVNKRVYLLKDTVNHRNLSNNLRYTGNTFYCPILKVFEPNLGFYQPVVRSYAKSRDKKKSDKGQKKKVQISEEIVSEVINSENMKAQMQDVIEKLKEDYIKNLSLRSTTGSIETIPVTYEGKEYILQDLAQVVRKNPKTVVINMTAFPQVIPTVVEALSKSGMNLNPQQDGTTIFIPIPKVTKEHRESLSKNAKALFIKCRDNIKDVQNKYMKAVKNKEKDGLARDTALQISEYIGFVASEYISSGEKLMEAKQQELLKETQ